MHVSLSLAERDSVSGQSNIVAQEGLTLTTIGNKGRDNIPSPLEQWDDRLWLEEDGSVSKNSRQKSLSFSMTEDRRKISIIDHIHIFIHARVFGVSLEFSPGSPINPYLGCNVMSILVGWDNDFMACLQWSNGSWLMMMVKNCWTLPQLLVEDNGIQSQQFPKKNKGIDIYLISYNIYLIS